MTVGELMLELSGYPKDTLVLIDDADTGWSMPVHIGPNGRYSCEQVGQEKALYIWGDYSEAIK